MQAKVDDILMDHPGRALGDVPKLRFCLGCDASFWSEVFGQRICARCKGTTAWRAAVQGDYGPFERLNAVLSHPYDDQPGNADLMRPPAEGEIVQATVCGT